ncbi:MAG: hypothetical protein ABIY90_07170 [Puia sp.]
MNLPFFTYFRTVCPSGKNGVCMLFFLLLIAGGKSQEVKQADKGSVGAVKWRVIGPGGGGGVFLPTISPFDDQLVLTHCDMTGAYISHNGGKDWRIFNLWTVPNDFAFDPVNPNVLYTATHGYRYAEDRGSGMSMLYRSEDKGKHWRIIYPALNEIKKADHLQSLDLLPSQIAVGAWDATIEKVAVDPRNNKKIYLGLAPLKALLVRNKQQEDSGSALLVLSADYGKRWKKIASLPGQHVKAIFPDNMLHPSGEVIVFTDSACVRINEQTGKLTRLPLPVKHLIAIAGGKNSMYIQSAFRYENGKITGGMYVSRDRGKNWVQINSGLLTNLAGNQVPSLSQGLAVCESQPEVAYISTTNPVLSENGAVEKTYCIFKTVNGGESWKPVLLSSGKEYLTHNYKGSWLDRSYGPGWGGSPINLGVAPGNPDICFAGDNGRCYKTTDGGKNWEQVYSRNLPDSTYASNGLDVTTCYGVHFDPFDKNHFFICYTDIGLFHTFNGGAGWSHSITGIPEAWQNTCYDVAFDPKINGRVWSVWANAHDLPREKMFGFFGFGRYAGGVAVSDDDGRTWHKTNTGIPENAICTNILLDTLSNSGKMYVSVFDQGVYKSSDGGKSWEKKNNGLGRNLFAWQVRQNRKGRLFVLLSRGLQAGKIVDGAIYFSDDAAETWKKLPLPAEVNGPHDLLIDPLNGDTMYVSCWPHAAAGQDAGGGLIRTEDGGLTWKSVFDKRIRVNAAGMDPTRHRKIFINTFQNAAFQSEDYGETWKRIEGYRFKWGQRVIPDIHHPGMLYLTTYGGSVYYGPVQTARGAFTDIENMPEGWW